MKTGHPVSEKTFRLSLGTGRVYAPLPIVSGIDMKKHAFIVCRVHAEYYFCLMDYKKIITDLGFTANTDEHSRVDSYKEKYSPNNGKVRLELIIADNDGINIDMRINCNGSFAPICVRYEPKTEDEFVVAFFSLDRKRHV